MCALVYNFNFIHQASIIKRPSKTSKTPYVADIILNNDETNTETMGHCPALGCCGHVIGGYNSCFYMMVIKKYVAIELN